MEQSEVESARRRVQEVARELLPGDAVREVRLLEYGDDPAVEPGQLVVQVLLPGPDAAERDERAGAGRDPLDAFKHAHRGALEQFRDMISREFPEVSFIEFIDEAGPERRGRMRWRMGHASADRPGDLTPVMARLAPTDLQTLDTLITTGIAANRADAVRWALARIRERPAYAELRERARQIEELKSQF
jgi:hypothetical protein